MSAILVDHDGIISRIIEILKNDTRIFDPINPKGKLRKILHSESDFGILDDSTPYAYVAIGNRFQSTRETIGTLKSTLSQALAEYDIVVISQKKDVSTARSELFGFIKNIQIILNSNPKFGSIADNTIDQKVTRSFISSISRFTPFQGRSLDAVRITISVQIGQEWQIKFIGLSNLTLNVISFPSQSIDSIPQHSLNDSGKVIDTNIPSFGQLDFQFENEESIRTVLEAKVGTTQAIQIIRNGTIIVTRNIFLTKYSIPIQYSDIDIAVLLSDIVS